MKSFKYKFNLSFSSEETVFKPSTSHVSKKVSKSFKNKAKRKGISFHVEKELKKTPNILKFNFNGKQLEIADELIIWVCC
jgi:hypothetical protein